MILFMKLRIKQKKNLGGIYFSMYIDVIMPQTLRYMYWFPLKGTIRNLEMKNLYTTWPLSSDTWKNYIPIRSDSPYFPLQTFASVCRQCVVCGGLEGEYSHLSPANPPHILSSDTLTTNCYESLQWEIRRVTSHGDIIFPSIWAQWRYLISGILFFVFLY